MTPFQRGVRAGIERAARVAEEAKADFLHKAVDAESDAVADQYAARAVGALAALDAITAIDPATVEDEG